MRSVLAVLLLLAAPVSAKIIPPWVGYWADANQDCALAGEMAEEMPIELTAKEEFGMEYSCEFERVQPLGVGNSWKIERKCLDAGFTEFWNILLVLTAEDQLVIIDDMGGVSRLTRCENPQK